jgi:type I restriction enzyme S subunit
LSVVGYPYLHYGDIHGAIRTFIDVCADNTIPRLDMPLSKVSKGSLLQNGDVVFVDASEDDEGASRHIVVRNSENKPFISGLHTIIAKSKNKELDNQYKEHCFQTEAVKAQFKFFAVGTKVLGVSKTSIKNILLSFPISLPEQRAIATALSDTDTYITALEKLIAKKRAIKQGAMQELLTGKLRLPGFSGKWPEERLKSFCENITTGKLDANAMIDGGQYRFYTCAKDYSYIDTYAFDTEALLVSGNGENVGYVHYYKGKFNAYQRTYVLTNFSVNIKWLKHYLDMFLSERIANEVNFGNTPYIKLDTLTDMVINCPDIPEQTAISAILSDMDAEIDVLTEKLNKMRRIKQGMMSELLTGRIRLRKQESTNG